MPLNSASSTESNEATEQISTPSVPIYDPTLAKATEGEEKSEARAEANDLIKAHEVSGKLKGTSNPSERLQLFDQVTSLLKLKEYVTPNANGLEILSDEPLTEKDLKFIGQIKGGYDSLLNGGTKKPMKLFILNSENWPVIAKCMNLQGQDELTGESVELPITPFDDMQAMLIPSRDVITLETKRKEQFLTLAKSDPAVSEALSQMGEGEKTEFYRSIYLRNMVAHEMSHLYQFSTEERAEISALSEKPEEQAEAQTKYLHLREWLACALGLYNMKQMPPSHTALFLRINEIAAQKLEKPEIQALSPNQRYPIEQANRTVQANQFFNLCELHKIDPKSLLQRMGVICASNDENRKLQLQQILKGQMDELKLDQIIKFIQ